MSVPIRNPTWVSKRRLLEQKISDLHRCSSLNQVKQIHAQVLKANLHRESFVGQKLIAAFSLCRQMTLAVNVFNQIQDPDVLLYNTLIRAHVRNSEPLLAFSVFFEMQDSGVCADNFTYPFLLKACSGKVWVRVVEMIHAQVEKMGFCLDIFVPNSLIDSYFKLGELGEARRLFDEMPERDTVSWNTILDGYVKAGEMNAAFELFEKMPARNVVSWSTMEAGLKFDDGTVISILSACAVSGLLGLGKRVHASIERTRFKCSTPVSNALIDMYAKCGSLENALSIFHGMVRKDVVSWNAIIQGLAMHGHGEKALQLFSRMKGEGFVPDKVTFVGVLCACTHAGFVDEGLHYFHAMERDYGVPPEVEHYGCMVDLLGRGGRLKEAFRLVHSMPLEPNAIIWGTLLGACRMHSATGLAEEVFDRLVKSELSDSGNLSMLSNIYAAAGDWDNFANIRLRMKSTSIQKPSGGSSIEVDDEVHEFTVFDRSHPKSDRIYKTIDGLGQHINKLTTSS
ncbi:unnamed protein product, partial [Vitis vinifera]